MAADVLNIRSMLSISEDMLTCKMKQELLERAPKAAKFMKALKQAHGRLAKVSGQEGVSATRVRELNQELLALNAEHNATTRGLHAGLQSAIELSPSSGESFPFEEVRSALFPEGLVITRASYGEQGAYAMRIQDRLTRNTRQTLSRVRIDGEGLNMHVERWVKIGKKMCERVAERAALLSEDVAIGTMTDDVRDARGEWVRVFSAFQGALEVSALSEDERRRMMMNYVDCVDAQHARRGGVGSVGPVGVERGDKAEINAFGEFDEGGEGDAGGGVNRGV